MSPFDRSERLLPCLVALAAAAGLACSGPDAPDGAVCRDVIHRLCDPPRCAAVNATFSVGDTCEADLLQRTGCNAVDFAFPEPPGRARILECRLFLLRAGGHPEEHPSCDDVAELIDTCGDVTAFLAGTPP